MDDWVFFPDENRVESVDQTASLTPKASAVLSLLVRNRDQVVSPDQILKDIWADVHVTPDLVREYIFDIRKALGDDARRPKYIETVRGKGFKLVGPVSVQSSAANLAMRRPRVAVLQPTLLAGDNNWQQYVEATAEELVTDIARFTDISVMARSSSFAIDKSQDVRTTGKILGCTYLIDSSFSFLGDTLSAHVQLIETETGAIAWAEKVNRPLEHLATFPSQWALMVANLVGGLDGRLARAERAFAMRRPSARFGAYEHYVLACNCEHGFDAETENEALHHIDLSIELDPDFARAHVVRSLLCARVHRHRTEKPRSFWQAEARKSIDAAFSLDRYDATTLAWRSMICARDGEVDVARNMVVSAIDRSMNQADAAVFTATATLCILGDVSVASKLLDQAYSLNTEPPGWYDFAKLRNAFFDGDFALAEQIARSCQTTDVTRIFQCLAQYKTGNLVGAKQTYSDILAASPDFDFDTFAQEFGITATSARSKLNTVATEFLGAL